MSVSEKEASRAARAEQKNDSVYDFLYYDAPRVGSFLAQFDPSGHITEIAQREALQRAKTIVGALSATGKALVVEGEASIEREVTAEGSREAERTYDPFWANARAFLDYLTSNDLIWRDLPLAGTGQLVLVKGALKIRDQNLLKGIWSLPFVTRMIKTQDRTSANKPKASGPSNAEVTAQVLPLLPHSIQVDLAGKNFRVWGTVRRESLVSEAADLVLKHGLIIEGEWAVLGVLDARPDSGAVAEEAPTVDPSAVNSSLYDVLAPIVRLALGRPASAYGITPLLIFREVQRRRR